MTAPMGLRPVEIDEGMLYGSPHRHRAIEQIEATITADIPYQVRKMVAEGWPPDDALRAVKRWWGWVAYYAIRDGIALVDTEQVTP